MLFFALAALSAALIANPEKYVPVCFEGIALWAQCVLPALFPFMVVCAILTNSGLADKISKPLARVCGALKLPPSAAIGFLMSITSGYPAGSRTVSRFYTSGLCDKEACEKLAFLCSTSGPVFLIGTVGAGMFGDGGIGAKIFAMHAISVVLVAVAISLFSKKKPWKGARCNKNTKRTVREFLRRGEFRAYGGSVYRVLLHRRRSCPRFLYFIPG